MASNLTDGWENFPVYMLYSVQGSVISVTNLLIAFSIIRYEALRTSKENLVMLSLSLSDSCRAGGFLAAGVHRIYLLLIGQHQELRSVWDCATKVHNILLTTGTPWSNLMLTLVSMDRLFSVIMPLTYLGWSYKYAYGILFPSLLFGIMNTASYLGVTYWISDQAKKVAARCVTNGLLREAPKAYALVYQALPTFFAFFSVVIYIGVWYQHKKYYSQVVPSGANKSEQKEQLRHQRKITVSLGISCVCTFLLFCLPMVIANGLLWSGVKRVPLMFYFLSTFNPLCNVFIYQIRHSELRMALKGLICWKELPIDIRMWNVNKSAVRRIGPSHKNSDKQNP